MHYTYIKAAIVDSVRVVASFDILSAASFDKHLVLIINPESSLTPNT